MTLRHVTSLGAVGPGSWYFDYGADRIFIGEDPTGKVVETSVTPRALFSSADGVQIRNLVVEKYANPAQEGAIDSRGSGGDGVNWVIDGVEARLNHGSGIHLMDGGTISNSYLHHNGQQGFSANGTGILVEDTEISFNNAARFSLDWEGGGNKLIGTDLTIRRNYSHDNYGPGIWIDIDSFNVVIEDNVVERNFRSGIFFEVSDTAYIRGNYSEGNGLDDSRADDWAWSSGILVASSGDAEIYDNVVVNNGNSITATQQNRGAGRLVEDLNVHDNTVTMSPDTVPPITNGWIGAVRDNGDDAIFTSRNNTFQNNTYRAEPTSDRFAWFNSSHTFTSWQSFGLDTTGSITPITTAPPTWSGSLTATGETDATVSLTWSGASDPDGIGAYRVYEDSLGLVATTAGASNTTVRFLQPARIYNFTVEAVDTMGNESTNGPSVDVTIGSAFTSTVTVETNPLGLLVAVDGGPPQAAPVAVTATEGSQVSVEAISPQDYLGDEYEFDSWSDGGDQIHDVTVPTDNLTVTANFVLAEPQDLVRVAADNGFELFVNGVLVGSGSDWRQSELFELDLSAGDVIGIRGVDAGGLAGVLAEVDWDGNVDGSGSSWRVATAAPVGWAEPGFDDSSWPSATSYGSYGVGPWFDRVAGFEVSSAAWWMWSGDSIADDEVFLRLTLGASTTYTYHVGNSLTWDMQPPGLEALAARRAHPHDTGYHIECGATLEQIWNNPSNTCVAPPAPYGTFASALPDFRWDSVSIQPYPGAGSTLLDDQIVVVDLIDLTQLKADNLDAVFYIYTGWPPTTVDFAVAWTQPVNDTDDTATVASSEYFAHLINRVRANTNASVHMIPVGDVLFELDQRMKAEEVPGYSGVEQLYRDEHHLNDIGRFVASITTFATIYGENPAGMTKPEGFFGEDATVLTPALYAAIHAATWEVVSGHPFSGVQ